MSYLTLNLDTLQLSDEQFYTICQNNRELQIEIYRREQDVEVRNLPTNLSGENVLPEFNLSLSPYFEI